VNTFCLQPTPIQTPLAAEGPPALVVESELVLTRDELQEALALGHERRSFEVKWPGVWVENRRD
jgi:hypothetical protein